MTTTLAALIEQENAQLRTMTNREVQSYWNILQFGKRSIRGADVETAARLARHEQILLSIMAERSKGHAD